VQIKDHLPILERLAFLIASIQIGGDIKQPVMKMATTQDIPGAPIAGVPIQKLQNAELRISVIYI
jgi:hypothetical protein